MIRPPPKTGQPIIIYKCNKDTEKYMNCWHCNTELIWGGDHDADDDELEYSMVTNLSCPNELCKASVLVYLPREDTNDMPWTVKGTESQYDTQN